MMLYLFFLLMAVNSCLFLEGDIYFKIYNLFLWFIIGYVYTSVVVVYREVIKINLFIRNIEEREAKMDKERLERIKKNLYLIPEEDKENVFDCFKEGYIVVNSEGYAVHKPYSDGVANVKTS